MKKNLSLRAVMAVLTMVLCALPAAAVSPATGERSSPLPYILMGVGLVALVAVLVLTMAGKKKKDGSAGSQQPRQEDPQNPADPQ